MVWPLLCAAQCLHSMEDAPHFSGDARSANAKHSAAGAVPPEQKSEMWAEHAGVRSPSAENKPEHVAEKHGAFRSLELNKHGHDAAHGGAPELCILTLNLCEYVANVAAHSAEHPVGAWRAEQHAWASRC